MTRHELREQRARLALTLEGYCIEHVKKGTVSNFYHIKRDGDILIFKTLRKAIHHLQDVEPC